MAGLMRMSEDNDVHTAELLFDSLGDSPGCTRAMNEADFLTVYFQQVSFRQDFLELDGVHIAPDSFYPSYCP